MENQLPHLTELMWMEQMIGGPGTGTEVGVFMKLFLLPLDEYEGCHHLITPQTEGIKGNNSLSPRIATMKRTKERES